jgi:hypothetical protein
MNVSKIGAVNFSAGERLKNTDDIRLTESCLERM